MAPAAIAGPSQRDAGVTTGPTAATGRNGWRANGSRANTIGRRCHIGTFSMEDTLFMAATTSLASDDPPRTAAFASTRKTPRYYSRSCKIVRTTRVSSLPVKPRCNGNAYARIVRPTIPAGASKVISITLGVAIAHTRTGSIGVSVLNGAYAV